MNIVRFENSDFPPNWCY